MLETLPPEIENLTNLKNLNISFNKIKTLPIEFYKLIELRKLDLKNNILSELDPAIGDLIMLETLVCSFFFYFLCFLIYIQKEVSNIINANYCLIFRIFPCKIVQNLSSNNLTELPIGTGYLVRLTSLDLSHNLLKELPPDITSMRGVFYKYKLSSFCIKNNLIFNL